MQRRVAHFLRRGNMIGLVEVLRCGWIMKRRRAAGGGHRVARRGLLVSGGGGGGEARQLLEAHIRSRSDERLDRRKGATADRLGKRRLAVLRAGAGRWAAPQGRRSEGAKKERSAAAAMLVVDG